MINKGNKTLPNGEAPAGGSTRASVGGAGNGEHLSAFLGDTQGDVICRITLHLGHRAVRFPCGQGRHVLHARCVVEAPARCVAPAQLRFPAVSCRAQHPRRDALEEVIQVGPGLCNWAARMGGGTAGDADLRSRGLWYGWDQNSLGVGPPLDAVSLDDLQQRFATGIKCIRSWQEHMRAKASMCWAYSTTPWESTGRTGTRRRRTRSCERLCYGTCLLYTSPSPRD